MSGLLASAVFALWSALGTVGRPPTTPPDPTPHAPPQRAWLGAGVGLGTWPYGSLSGVASGWYSRGPAAIGARVASTGEWFGEQRGDRAFLVGAKTRGDRGFILAGAGVARIASSRTCDGPCGVLTRPAANAIAYTIEAHAK